MNTVVTVEDHANNARARAGFPVGYHYPLFVERDPRTNPVTPGMVAEIARQAEAASALYADAMPAQPLTAGHASLRRHVLALAALARAWQPASASVDQVRLILAAEEAAL